MSAPYATLARMGMTCIDLFAGAGGLSRGLHDAGFEPVWAVEIDKAACTTYRNAFPGVKLFDGDVAKVNFSEHTGVDVVAGGPPCQPFSVAGNLQIENDPRDCIPHFVRAVSEIRPAAFIMENVPGLIGPRARDYFERVLESFRNLGYEVTAEVLNAADYGVPQFRRRLFVVGMRDGSTFEFPRPTHGPSGALPYLTTRDVISDAPADEANRAIVTYARNPVMRPQPYDGMLVNGGGRPINLDEPSQTIPASAGGNRTHIVDEAGVLLKYHRHLREGGVPREGLVNGVRRLTVSESARIQSFPDHHVFLGKQSARYRQVGNAVPPRLAAAVGTAVFDHLNRGRSAVDLHTATRLPLQRKR